MYLNKTISTILLKTLKNKKQNKKNEVVGIELAVETLEKQVCDNPHATSSKLLLTILRETLLSAKNYKQNLEKSVQNLEAHERGDKILPAEKELYDPYALKRSDVNKFSESENSSNLILKLFLISKSPFWTKLIFEIIIRNLFFKITFLLLCWIERLQEHKEQQSAANSNSNSFQHSCDAHPLSKEDSKATGFYYLRNKINKHFDLNFKTIKNMTFWNLIWFFILISEII